MDLKTHLKINPSLCGKLLSLDDGKAVVKLETSPQMAVDNKNLVHGGFIFGAADFAAMAAVNDPTVVLGSADVKFLKPTQSGDCVTFEATIRQADGKRRLVDVKGIDNKEETIFSGLFTCFVLDRHVLE